MWATLIVISKWNLTNKYIMHNLYSRKAEPFHVNIEMQSFIHFANTIRYDSRV